MRLAQPLQSAGNSMAAIAVSGSEGFIVVA